MVAISKVVFREYEFESNDEESKKMKEMGFEVVNSGYDVTVYFEDENPNREFITEVGFYEDCADLLDLIGIDYEVYDKNGEIIEERRSV